MASLSNLAALNKIQSSLITLAAANSTDPVSLANAVKLVDGVTVDGHAANTTADAAAITTALALFVDELASRFPTLD